VGGGKQCRDFRESNGVRQEIPRKIGNRLGQKREGKDLKIPEHQRERIDKSSNSNSSSGRRRRRRRRRGRRRRRREEKGEKKTA